MTDLIIIGAGISGMTASIYASRYGIKHLILGEDPGGQGNLAHTVENYPGIASIKGPDLMEKIIAQVENYGVRIKREKVVSLEVEPLWRFNLFRVKTSKREGETKSLILAMGAGHRHLNIPGEEKFLGKGVSYCTVCDGPLFRNKTVAMVGGGNAAVTGAIHLSKLANKVYLIHRRDELRAEKVWVDKLKEIKNIEVILSTEVEEVLGKERVEGVKLQTTNYKLQDLSIDGLFIEVGKVPSSALASQLGVDLDEKGFVLVGPNMETNVPGVFAAGDLCLQKGETLLCQLLASAAKGAKAAASVYHYITKKPVTPSWGTGK